MIIAWPVCPARVSTGSSKFSGMDGAVNIWQTGRVHVQGKGSGHFDQLLSLAHASSMGPESKPSKPSFASFSSDSPTSGESESPGQAGSSHFPTQENGFGASFLFLLFLVFLRGSFVSLLRVTTCLLVSLLLLLMSCLCESLSVHAFQGFEPIQAQAHPRKRITSRITPRCKVPPFSRRFQGFFLFQDCCGHTVVFDAPLGSFLCFSDQAPIRATALHSFDILRLTQFDSVLVEGPVAYTPSGAHPGSFLCQLLVLFSSIVPFHVYLSPLLC